MRNKLESTIAHKAQTDGQYAVAYALLRIAEQLKRSGTAAADAAEETPKPKKYKPPQQQIPDKPRRRLIDARDDDGHRIQMWQNPDGTLEDVEQRREH